eukprot:GFUD01080792.1.p1 GENE.GFUD01080792.1~~GFUD01080792.1.p1  ORF type:complete len:178 (+),score=77.05 GFUD01080792.1:40-534(+)
MEQPSKEELKEAFKKADEEGTGKLNFSQLKTLMLAMATEEHMVAMATEGDVDQITDLIMKMADINGDKMVDYEELVKFIYDEETDPKEKMKEAFRLCDTDRDGFICKKELAEFLKLAGDETEFLKHAGDETGDESKLKIVVMMALFDQDGDGKLSYQEFCDMME